MALNPNEPAISLLVVVSFDPAKPDPEARVRITASATCKGRSKKGRPGHHLRSSLPTGRTGGTQIMSRTLVGCVRFRVRTMAQRCCR